MLPLCAGQGKPCPEEGGGKPPHSKATIATADSSPPETRFRMTGGVQGRAARGLLGWRRVARTSPFEVRGFCLIPRKGHRVCKGAGRRIPGMQTEKSPMQRLFAILWRSVTG